MRYPIIGFFCGFFLLGTIFVSPVFARSEAKKLYETAEEKYSKGEVDEAISDLENALEIDTNFRKAEDLLLKILTTVSTEYYAKGDYERAFPYLTKANNLVPENAKIKYMYEIVSKELKAKEAKKKAAELEAQSKAEEERREAELEARKKEKEVLERKRQEEEKREREVEDRKRKEEKEKEKAQFETKVKTEREQADRLLLARKEELAKATTKYEEIRKRLKQTILFGIIGISLSFLLAIFLIFIIFTHSDRRFQRRWKGESDRQDEFRQRVEKILLENQERILGLLEKQSRSFIGEAKKIVVEGPGGRREIITDINPHIRARADGVELIESTVDDPDVGERLLKPFLEDRESRIRGNAVKALYKFNKEKAMVILTDMCKSNDQWMRLSGAWALGEISSQTAAEILLSLLQDPWEFVRKRAAKSLEKILAQRKEKIEGNLLERIEAAVKEVKK
jgi:tetratricopeptide (TPR) repeat protein